MKASKILVAALAASLAGASLADTYSTDFSGPTTIWTGGDQRTPGDGTWWNPSNSATSSYVGAGMGYGGGNAMVIGNNGSGNDGVIQNLTSARLVDPAGESSVAPNSLFQSSFQFRTASDTYNDNFLFKSEAWGSDRDTWLRFRSNGAGGVAVEADGYNPDGSDTLYDLGLSLNFGTWYTVKTSIQFNDGPDNDVVTQSIYDETGSILLGSQTLTSWEGGQEVWGFNNGMPVAVDALGFQCRGAAPGDQAFISNVSYSSAPVPEPATLTAMGVGALALVRRRRAKK